ncbi:GTP cyclohydrolase II [Fructilactobacillus carniphilus]|uniref:GTP cyclohydrolase-2 n=1 Tax=Fructilactobacillus carniphilus TaxID=2940297 RepID=A0ABY5C120_9LACO|nr:GTP cyclohydrolase II [Fructilactobacillus carniphilus]USS91308.1 GTP cyclohydrolase II [Fructilactobacillus carniphilus]
MTRAERVKAAVRQLQQGGLVVVADDQDREGEGDLIGLAEKMTPATVNRMVTQARGLLCVPMAPEQVQRLGLQPMAHEQDAFGTAFLQGTDAKATSTGISAVDRATTIQRLANPHATHDDFYHPGHLFPLQARQGGVLARNGHTEAAVDLAKLAGAMPVAVIIEILRPDGTMMRQAELQEFAQRQGYPFITIADLQAYRKEQVQQQLQRLEPVQLPTQFGTFQLTAYQTTTNEEPALLISKGRVTADEPLLLRVHSECFTGDVLGSLRCDCGEQLATAFQTISANSHGAVLYLRQEGRGIGLANKLAAYRLQEQGLDTVEANQELGFAPDERDYELVAAILRDQGVTTIDLMTNNPDKIEQLESAGIIVRKRVPLEIPPHATNRAYLETKKHKMQHMLKEID